MLRQTDTANGSWKTERMAHLSHVCCTTDTVVQAVDGAVPLINTRPTNGSGACVYVPDLYAHATRAHRLSRLWHRHARNNYYSSAQYTVHKDPCVSHTLGRGYVSHRMF